MRNASAICGDRHDPFNSTEQVKSDKEYSSSVSIYLYF